MGPPFLVSNSFAMSQSTRIEGFSRESDFTVGIHHAILSAAPLTNPLPPSPLPTPSLSLSPPWSPLAGALTQLQRRPAALLSDKSVDNSSGHVVGAGAMTHRRCCWRGRRRGRAAGGGGSRRLLQPKRPGRFCQSCQKRKQTGGKS